MTRWSEREIEKLIDALESGGGPGPSIVFAERRPHGERHYHDGQRTVDERAAAEAAVVIGKTPEVERVIDEETLEVSHAHPIDPETGETVEEIGLEPDTLECIGVANDADPKAVVREHPALFSRDAVDDLDE